MKDLKNINTESDFDKRTGLVVWLHSTKPVKRLMKFGYLHYVSNRMKYALLYVDTDKVEQTMKRLNKENYVKNAEQTKMRDLPLDNDNVLAAMQKDIDEKKREERRENSTESSPFSINDW